jgi:hypothetical protein
MTRIQVGDVCTESNGDEFTVFIDQYANEAPDAVTIDGKAANMVFDPSTQAGRAQIRVLIARLNEAMAIADAAAEDIYGALKVGDHCSDIRIAAVITRSEDRCPHAAGEDASTGLVRCMRPAHEDYHHVAVDEHYDVIAVRHATDRILPANVPWSVR